MFHYRNFFSITDLIMFVMNIFVTSILKSLSSMYISFAVQIKIGCLREGPVLCLVVSDMSSLLRIEILFSSLFTYCQYQGLSASTVCAISCFIASVLAMTFLLLCFFTVFSFVGFCLLL